MKRPFLLFLPFLLFIAGAFVACEEVEEPGIYANWQQRNEAFIDSIKTLTGDNIVATIEQADKMELGKLYAIEIPYSGGGTRYVYCKKLVANIEGERPMYTGYHSVISVYYYGTYITGDSFDNNFDGYGATDQHINLPLPETAKWPTDFNSPSTFGINSGVISGWQWPLQHMRMGERWILYIPSDSGYGPSDYVQELPDGTQKIIFGHSTLTFDIILDSFVE